MPVGNPAYAYLVTSTIARGRIERLALDAAFAVPGVLDILTQDNTGELKNLPFKTGRGGVSTSIQNSSRDRMPVRSSLFVIADTFEAARRGGGKVGVTYATGRQRDLRVVAPDGRRRRQVSDMYSKLPSVGDVEAALRCAGSVNRLE